MCLFREGALKSLTAMGMLDKITCMDGMHSLHMTFLTRSSFVPIPDRGSDRRKAES